MLRNQRKLSKRKINHHHAVQNPSRTEGASKISTSSLKNRAMVHTEKRGVPETIFTSFSPRKRWRLLPVRTMLRLYSKETRPKINDHEWLKSKGHLVDWKSLDRNDRVIFVSHESNTITHTNQSLSHTHSIEKNAKKIEIRKM